MLFVILILESNGDRMKREIEKEWEGKNNRFFISLIRADAVCHNRCYFFDAALMMRKSNRSIERRRRRRRRRQHSTRKLNNSYWNVNFRQEILCDWLAAVCESELWFQHTHTQTYKYFNGWEYILCAKRLHQLTIFVSDRQPVCVRALAKAAPSRRHATRTAHFCVFTNLCRPFEY